MTEITEKELEKVYGKNCLKHLIIRIFHKFKREFDMDNVNALRLAKAARSAFFFHMKGKTKTYYVLFSLSVALCYINMMKIRIDSEGKLKGDEVGIYLDSAEEAQYMLMDIGCFKGKFEDRKAFSKVMTGLSADVKKMKKFIRDIADRSEKGYKHMLRIEDEIDLDSLIEMSRGGYVGFGGG